MTTDHTAHPAPTPAPVAVPEGGWQERDAVVVHYDDGGHTVLGVWTRRGQSWQDSLGRYLPIPLSDDSDPVTEWVEQGMGHGSVVYVHAPRENARPEPVVAPLPSEPAPEAVVLDRDGDAWQRGPEETDGWWCSSPVDEQDISWPRLFKEYGPLRRLVPEDDEGAAEAPGGAR